MSDILQAIPTIASRLTIDPEWLEKPFEIGGYVDSSEKPLAWHVTTEGRLDLPIIDETTAYPMSSGKISFHTHPTHATRILLPPDLPHATQAIPSNTDLSTSLHAALHYQEPSVDMVVSDQGLFFYYVQPKLLDLLMEMGEDERQEVVYEYILPNVAGAIGNAFFTDPPIETFQRNLLTVFDNGSPYTFGWNSVFVNKTYGTMNIASDV